MLFTSGLRKAVGTTGKTQNDALLELKRSQLRRRHTCATIVAASVATVERRAVPKLETFHEQEDSDEVTKEKSADLRRQRSQIEIRVETPEHFPKVLGSSKVIIKFTL